MSRLFIRTEASAQIGMGHFMRCFAVAEYARRKKIGVTFLLNHIDDAVAARCRPIGIVVEAVMDWGNDLVGLKSVVLPDDWLMIDSYHATADYIAELHNGAQIAVLDDLDVLDRFDCDLLINPAMAAPEASYRQKTTARLLLGPDYALIRSEFRKPGTPLVAGPSVAVMFGGSDPTGLTAQVARQLHDTLPGVTVKVIAGPANSRIAELEALVAELPRLRLFVSPRHMGQVLGGSDLVVTAAGGSVGEVAAMGLAALVLVVYDNQRAALEACPFPVIDGRDRLPHDLAERVKAMMNNAAERKAVARAGHRVVDGKGAQRVVEAMFRV